MMVLANRQQPKVPFKKDYLRDHYQMLRLIPIKQKLGDHGEWV